MAYISQAQQTSFLSIARKAIVDFFVSMFNLVDLAASANARVAQMERLQAKSDAELAEMGLRREDIARHVFRDIYHL